MPETEIIRQHIERFTAGEWGIYWRGIRIKTRSGKSTFVTEAKAKVALKNHFRYSYLYSNIMRARGIEDNWSDRKGRLEAFVAEQMSTGQLQIRKDLTNGTAS